MAQTEENERVQLRQMWRDVIQGPFLDQNVVAVVMGLMRATEKLGKLSGPTKKEVVISALQDWVSTVADESDPDESQARIWIEGLLHSVVPHVIDGLVEVDKHGLAPRGWWARLKKWRPCCSRSAPGL